MDGMSGASSASVIRRPMQELHMGGCQNDGPLLVPYYNTAPNI